MNDNLDTLLNRTMRLISDFARKNDTEAISGLAPIATQLNRLKRLQSEVEVEKTQIHEALIEYTKRGENSTQPLPRNHEPVSDFRNGQRRMGKKIRIEIDWKRIGKDRATETICMHKASDAITKWATRFYEELGPEVLRNLSAFQVGRGMLVSRSPETDYRTPEGKPYQSRPILNSGYFILTHSETSEKVEDIQNACRHLKLPIGSVSVEAIEKHEF
jgi:hypothetical protein